MPDNNVKNDNYDAEKEIMKINNVDVSEDDWIDGVFEITETAENIIKGNDEDKELYRDYKHLNLETVKRLLKKNIVDMKPSSILNKINKDFINRK